MGRRVTSANLSRPALLRASHVLAEFDCGEAALNTWLQRRALAAHAARTANTFVVCRGTRVVGYFSLANGAVAHSEASAKVRQNMPNPIPATVLARLAVDKTEQGHGIGNDLLQEAMRRTLVAARHVAAKLLIVHPLNTKARDYYTKYGFSPLRVDADALYIPLETIAAAL